MQEAFLNALLARAQRSCCAGRNTAPTPGDVTFDEAVALMFREEWQRQRGTGVPGRIAIVDDDPGEQ